MIKRDKYGLSIFYKLLLSFLLIITLLSGSMTVVYYVFSKKSIEHQTRERMHQVFIGVKDHFIDDLDSYVKDIRLLASNPLLDEFIMSSEVERMINARALERLFLKAMNLMQDAKNISFADYSGKEQVKVDTTGRIRKYRDISESTLFKKIVDAPPNGIDIESLSYDKYGNVSLSMGIHKLDPDIGEFGGTVIIEYNLRHFIEDLDEIKIFNGDHIWAFTPDRQVIKQPSDVKTSFDPRPHISDEYQDKPLLLSFREGMVLYQDFSFFPGIPMLRLAISIPSTVLFEDINRVLRFLAVVFILSLVTTFFIVIYLSRYLSKPIAKLADAASRLSKGDLSTRVQVTSGGEVQMLVDSFNRMASDLDNTTVSRDYVDSIITNMRDTLIVISPDGIIQTVNKATCDLLGYKEEELIGQSFETIFNTSSFFISEHDQPGSHEYADDNEKLYVRKDGGKVPVLVSSAVMQDNAGNAQGFVYVARDITERKTAEEELKTFSGKLEQSNRELQEFAYVASHDLQEPLRKVTAFGDRLNAKFGDTLGEQGRDYIQRMQNAASRMSALIEGLLHYSRVTTQAKPFERVDLAQVAQDVVADLEILIDQTGASVEVKDLPTIDADPLQMRQLLQNLIGNALKFNKKDTKPVVTIYGKRIDGNNGGPDSDLYELTVEDNGIGFKEEHLDRIFGVFQRLHGRNEYEGTGIGLSVCKKIAERHSGSITAEGSDGEGARFIVTLPVRQERGAAEDSKVYCS